jgi:glycosyltransferase involved in cell wall biosynthesis
MTVTEAALMVPTISIVIPTHDRPDTLARLLLCIKQKQQSYHEFECLVIDDGSSDATLTKYDAIWTTLDDRFHLHLKGKNERGGGPGKTRNIGIRLARGRFIAFCDDDDMWIRDDHLSESVAALTKYEADLFFANMQTSRDGDIIIRDWCSVASGLLSHNPTRGTGDIFQVTIKDVRRFLVQRIIHTDTLVVEKRLMTQVGMYYEREIFGEDYDIIFRLVDNARKIIFRSTVVANLDVSPHPSFIRSYQVQERLLLTILAALRAETQVADPGLRRVARSNRAWFMVELAQLMLQDGRRRQTCELAAQALLVHPSGEALRLIGRALLGR